MQCSSLDSWSQSHEYNKSEAQRLDLNMHYYTTAVAVLAALSQTISVVNAYVYDSNIGTPVCSQIYDQGKIDLSEMDCGASDLAFAACNYMCTAQSHGCQWGCKSSIFDRYFSLVPLTHLSCRLLVQRTIH